MTVRILRGQSGAAVPVAVLVLMVVILFTSATLAYALRSVDTSNRDRNVKLALQAADAGADLAGWRMNRVFISGNVTGLLTLPLENLGRTQCVGIEVGELTLYEPPDDDQWCHADPGDEPAGVLESGAEFRYNATLGVTAGPDEESSKIIDRVVVSTGYVNGVQRRVKVVYRLDLNDANLGSLWRRHRYVECSPEPTGPAPDSGCPGPSASS